MDLIENNCRDWFGATTLDLVLNKLHQMETQTDKITELAYMVSRLIDETIATDQQKLKVIETSWELR